MRVRRHGEFFPDLQEKTPFLRPLRPNNMREGRTPSQQDTELQSDNAGRVNEKEVHKSSDLSSRKKWGHEGDSRYHRWCQKVIVRLHNSSFAEPERFETGAFYWGNGFFLLGRVRTLSLFYGPALLVPSLSNTQLRTSEHRWIHVVLA